MFKEFLKFIPKLESADLAKLERDLNKRFGKVAKGFGKGLMGALKGGGLVGVGLSLVDKILNPLKDTQDAIDRTLNSADDVVTNAEQFNSTPGELFKLQKLAQAKGLDADALNQLLVKFQGAVAEAANDPSKPTAVREYANDRNMVQSFYEFIQNLNKMDRKQQVSVQQEVFGEKQTLKMADFLRADFQGLEQRLKVGSADRFTPGLEKLGGLADKQDELRAAREAQDMMTKSRVISDPMITARANAEKLELQKENERIANYKNLQSINDTAMKIMGLVEKGVFMLGDFIGKITPTINGLVDRIDKISKSGFFRGIFGGKDK